jgi:hypothetical protein
MIDIKDRPMRDKAIELWGGAFGEVMATIDPLIASMPEAELEQHFRATPIDFFIRRRFWTVSEKYINSGLIEPETQELYIGICKKQHFYQSILRNPYKVAWILQPVQAISDLIDESLYFAIKKVRDELLTMPTNEKTAGHIMKALEFFANRSKDLGPLLQKIEQKSMNVNLDGNRAMREALNPDDIDKRLKELKSQIVSLPEAATNVQEPE